MERLRIEYETGYMELIVEAFFPCKLPVARKTAPLINKYCSDETRAELLSELCEMVDGYKALCGMYKAKYSVCPADSPQRRHWKAQFNKTEILCKRMERNIKLIFGGNADEGKTDAKMHGAQ